MGVPEIRPRRGGKNTVIDNLRAPTTDQVRDAYARACQVFGDPDRTYEGMADEFDRWMQSMQGEPSDAQVEAAARAIADHQGVRYNSSLVDTWDGMARAALRAAGGLR